MLERQQVKHDAPQQEAVPPVTKCVKCGKPIPSKYVGKDFFCTRSCKEKYHRKGLKSPLHDLSSLRAREGKEKGRVVPGSLQLCHCRECLAYQQKVGAFLLQAPSDPRIPDELRRWIGWLLEDSEKTHRYFLEELRRHERGEARPCKHPFMVNLPLPPWGRLGAPVSMSKLS
ncbi:MAG: hypothetical protein A3K19_11820 [Lentisphaerae bacterium RIFOXYB12_FULL_65_16]|nr:MAG: hypothetical protein A3K18_23290 [Lentisphaerae bacterium RIFOXYA12_64_32]OGV87999.1 MAG: hypothetical protein A3K19_11820 [Lentisphaerae bacterium RIFOXYB12_FULL_65_16]